jgi:SAM-dependent methyltransferase
MTANAGRYELRRNRMAIEPIAPPGLHEKVLEIALSLPAKKFLDVPTGHGALAEKLLAADREVVAADIDTDKFKVAGNSSNLQLLRLDLNEVSLPLPESAFDAVVSVEGIEHLQSQWCFVRNMYRALKPGGFFIITTPNILNIRSRLRYFMEGRYEHFKRPLVKGKSWSCDLDNYHIAPVSFFELQFILESSGFSIQAVHTNKYKAKNVLTGLLKPLIRSFYLHKNYRDKKRGRGDHRQLYDLIMTNEVFFGECLIVIARKPKEPGH